MIVYFDPTNSKVVEREKEEREAIESKLEEAEKERKKLRRQVLIVMMT